MPPREMTILKFYLDFVRFPANGLAEENETVVMCHEDSYREKRH